MVVNRVPDVGLAHALAIEEACLLLRDALLVLNAPRLNAPLVHLWARGPTIVLPVPAPTPAVPATAPAPVPASAVATPLSAVHVWFGVCV